MYKSNQKKKRKITFTLSIFLFHVVQRNTLTFLVNTFIVVLNKMCDFLILQIKLTSRQHVD